jgi:hypothetical protein
MAIRFQPLPLDVFPEEARRYIRGLNVFLREMSGLEGTLNKATSTKRSDSTIVRNESRTVEETRVGPQVSVNAFRRGDLADIGDPQIYAEDNGQPFFWEVRSGKGDKLWIAVYDGSAWDWEQIHFWGGV